MGQVHFWVCVFGVLKWLQFMYLKAWNQYMHRFAWCISMISYIVYLFDLKSFGSCLFGVWMVGVLTLPFGLGQSVMSLAAGGLVKYAGGLVMIIAALVGELAVLVNAWESCIGSMRENKWLWQSRIKPNATASTETTNFTCVNSCTILDDAYTREYPCVILIDGSFSVWAQAMIVDITM